MPWKSVKQIISQFFMDFVANYLSSHGKYGRM